MQLHRHADTNVAQIRGEITSSFHAAAGNAPSPGAKKKPILPDAITPGGGANRHHRG